MKQQASLTVPVATEREVEHVVVLDAELATTSGVDDDETYKGHPQPRARVPLVQRVAVLTCVFLAVLLAVWYLEEIADAVTVVRRPIIEWKQRRLGLMGPSPPEYSTAGAEVDLANTEAELVTAQIQIVEAELAAAAPAAPAVAAHTNLAIAAETRAETRAATVVATIVAMMGEGGNDDLDEVTAYEFSDRLGW
jgi:hypothetical protein